MEVVTAETEDGYEGAPFEIVDVPTLDDGFIICASCGGRFAPQALSRDDESSEGLDGESADMLSEVTEKMRLVNDQYFS